MKVYIVAAKRTAIGKFMGSLSGFHPAELGAKVISQLIQDTGIDPKKVDAVIAGNILSAGQGQGIARQCAIKAGIPQEVPAYAINMVCGSGMKAIMNGYADIMAGDASVVIAGGTESMSTAGFVMPGGNIRNGVKMGNISAIDHMVFDGLTDAFQGYHMGITAENIAEKHSISREQQDDFAWSSQQKAIHASDAGAFDAEIVPVEIVTRKETVVFKQDEYPNRATNRDKLGTLRAAFKKEGTVTAGNASGINDGASFVMLASEKAVKELNLTPLAEIVAHAQAGVDPAYMGLGPVPAIAKVLTKANMTLNDMELLELNEAFAAQSLGVVKELALQHGVEEQSILDRCNVNGGAIALGHPIGASGNRIVVTLVHALKAAGKELGLASLCVGGGMGTAIIIKNIE
ncbi:MAG: acetyl-CoA C-acetyltransferase [Bacteroidetes bacterium]|nr:MAG: acetyl-CoA C-acetyltransferase [Bacteroidota bacterium]